MIDIKKVQQEAAAELAKEKGEAAKKKVKGKLIEIEAAEIIVRNLKRELEDIYAQLGQ